MESSKNYSKSKLIDDVDMVYVQEKREPSAKRKAEAINVGAGSSKNPACLTGTDSFTYGMTFDEDHHTKSEDKVAKFSQVSKIANKVASNTTIHEDMLKKIDPIRDGSVSSKDPEVAYLENGVFKIPEYPIQFSYGNGGGLFPKNPISEGEINLAKSFNENFRTKSENTVGILSLVSEILNNFLSVTTIIKDEMDRHVLYIYQRMQTIGQKKLELEQIANTIKELQLDLKPQSKIEASEAETEQLSRQIKRKEEALMRFLAKKCKQEEKLRELAAYQCQTMGEN